MLISYHRHVVFSTSVGYIEKESVIVQYKKQQQ